jgi:Uma2 family endonuclease
MTEQQLLLHPPTTEQRLTMSYESFLQWSDDTHAEWVNGEVIVFMPPLIIHQHLLSFLDTLLTLYAQIFNLGRVLTAPCEMRHLPGYASREPDLLFIAQANLHRLTSERVDGPADLVIEIVSPTSVKRDYATKFGEYQQAGIREYWIVDPRDEAQQTTFYQLDEQQTYQEIPLDNQGCYHSLVLPGFWLRPAWLMQTNLPAVSDVMLMVCGDAYIAHLQKRQQELGLDGESG